MDVKCCCKKQISFLQTKVLLQRKKQFLNDKLKTKIPPEPPALNLGLK